MEKHTFVLPSVLILMVFLNLTLVAANPKILEECKVAEKATDEDITNLRNFVQPHTKGVKCLLACLGEKSGKIVNNKLNPDALLNSIKSRPDYTPQLQQSVTEIVAECKDLSDPELCEAGAKILDCLEEGAFKRGIKLYARKL